MNPSVCTGLRRFQARACLRLLARLVWVGLTFTSASSAWACGSTANVSWDAPTQNTDGSPLTDLDHYLLYWRVGSGTGYPGMTVVPAPATSYQLNGLPVSGTCYFRVAAVNDSGVSSGFSNEAVKGDDVSPPGKPSIAVSWSIPPPVAASVRVTAINTFAEFDLELVGTVDFKLTAPQGQQFDYCAPTIPTTPPLGTNNDGTLSRIVTIRGPVASRCDIDPPSFTGFTVEVNGVSKPLVQSGNVWSVSF